MATDEDTKNGKQNRSTPPENPVPDVAKKSKKGCVLLGCIVALLMLFFPFAPFTILFLIAVVLLTVFLDKHATISNAVRKHTSADPETSSESESRNRYGGLLGILAVVLFFIGINVLLAILRR